MRPTRPAFRADTLVDLADALEASPEERIAALEEARSLYEQKQHLLGLARVEAELADRAGVPELSAATRYSGDRRSPEPWTSSVIQPWSKSSGRSVSIACTWMMHECQPCGNVGPGVAARHDEPLAGLGVVAARAGSGCRSSGLVPGGRLSIMFSSGSVSFANVSFTIAGRTSFGSPTLAMFVL